MTPRLKTLAAAIGISAALLPCVTFAGITDASVEQPGAFVGMSHPASGKIAPKRADPLAAAAEVFENLAEGAPSLTARQFDKSLARFEVLHPSVSRRLPSASRARLDTLVGSARAAWRLGDRGKTALQSIEAYRLLQESIDYTGQPVPVEVALLDYAGFKLNALMLSTQPDWPQVVGTAQESSTWWKAIGRRVSDAKLRGAMDQTVSRMKDAALRKNPALLRVAANEDLTLVDALETFFSSYPRIASNAAPLARSTTPAGQAWAGQGSSFGAASGVADTPPTPTFKGLA